MHKQSGELHPQTTDLIEAVAKRVEQGGIEAWFALDKTELLGDTADDYEKVDDTLDVWFDSGVTHYSVLAQRDELKFPAEMYLEGSDQHRGWFQSSLLASVAMNGVAPYTGVLTHGFTVDAKGMKMSKSRGNVIAPQKVVNSLGADVLRLWVAATDSSGEMSVSQEILTRVADGYRRLRNTARFLLGNLDGFDPAADLIPGDRLLALDRWAVERASSLQAEIREAYDGNQFHLVYQKVHNFCAVDMGSFYLDVIKDRQYTTGADSLPRRSAQTAMYHIVSALARWFAPVLSFTGEEIWQQIPGEGREDSVFLATWYDGFPDLLETDMDANFWTHVIQVRNAVNKELEAVRSEGQIGSSLEAEVDLYCPEQTRTVLERLGDELRFALITSEARIHQQDARPDSARETELEGLWIKAEASPHGKCTRCWHRRADVGNDPTHPEICARCVGNISGDGESRRFA